EPEFCSAQMFTFNACDARGMPHDERRILTQLIRVVEMSPETDVGVGILTTAERDVWAEAYGRLGQNTQNAASLEAIKKAAVVVCLDGGLEDAEPFEVAWPRQIVLGEDGGSAFLFDHTVCDGTVMARITSHCYNYAHSDDTDRLYYQFSNYGKKFVKSCNMSPEGYVQMAMQLAVFRTWGSHFFMFGAASARKFLHGRVELYNTISEESRTFCRVFDSPRSSWAEKEQSLRKAVARTKQNAVLANIQCDGTTFEDPSLPNMCLTPYNIRPESFIFGISSSKSFPNKNAAKLKDALEKALTELGDCPYTECVLHDVS
ncbi:carnitine acyltransferase, putative, partial [Ixodes scapularis]